MQEGAMIQSRFALAATAMLAAAPAAAQTGWAQIGGGQVSGATATIEAHGEPTYHELMFCIDGHAARIATLILHYSDNHVQNIDVHARIAQGACSRGFSLSAHNKAVTGVDVAADAASLAGGTADLQLFAR
jgi:hypothetical protein